jgi:hypothetical protein
MFPPLGISDEHPPMAQRKYEPGAPMNLANMKRQAVRSLAVYCLNYKCLHRSVLNVDSYPAGALVQSFGTPRWSAPSAG